MATTTSTIMTDGLSKKEARKAEKAKLKKEREEAKATSALAEAAVEDQRASPDESSGKPKKKRKRKDEDVDELEIDVSLPEPPSKKALRKAKKQKPHVTNDTDPGIAPADDNGHEGASEAQPAQQESSYGIWIGNLPWTITKPMLTNFFTTNAEAMGNSIPAASITRVHLPAPHNARPDREGNKPVNKGFAYVDFNSAKVLQAALELSETPFGGRNVLIKEAKNFEGRPEKDVMQGAELQAGSKEHVGPQPKPVSRRVFVGNLGFDVTKDDLKTHYATCGTVEDIHMATFEDTGKCKGFAWVTFESTAASEAAVRGWVRIEEDDDEDDAAPAQEEDEQDSKPKKEKKPRTRKWFVNRLLGRQLRCEFAEDATTRYKKRFGKDSATSKQHANGESDGTQFDGSYQKQRSRADPNPNMSAKDRRRADKIAALGSHGTKAYGGDEADGRYRTGGIAPATGTKITFD